MQGCFHSQFCHFGKYRVHRDLSLDESGNIPNKTNMKTLVPITEDDVRACLIEAAEEFSSLSGMSFSAIGIAAVGDSKFITRVRNGQGFNIKTYQRVLSWIGAQKCREAAE